MSKKFKGLTQIITTKGNHEITEDFQTNTNDVDKNNVEILSQRNKVNRYTNENSVENVIQNELSTNNRHETENDKNKCQKIDQHNSCTDTKNNNVVSTSKIYNENSSDDEFEKKPATKTITGTTINSDTDSNTNLIIKLIAQQQEQIGALNRKIVILQEKNEEQKKNIFHVSNSVYRHHLRFSEIVGQINEMTEKINELADMNRDFEYSENEGRIEVSDSDIEDDERNRNNLKDSDNSTGISLRRSTGSYSLNKNSNTNTNTNPTNSNTNTNTNTKNTSITNRTPQITTDMLDIITFNLDTLSKVDLTNTLNSIFSIRSWELKLHEAEITSKNITNPKNIKLIPILSNFLKIRTLIRLKQGQIARTKKSMSEQTSSRPGPSTGVGYISKLQTQEIELNRLYDEREIYKSIFDRFLLDGVYSPNSICTSEDLTTKGGSGSSKNQKRSSTIKQVNSDNDNGITSSDTGSESESEDSDTSEM